MKAAADIYGGDIEARHTNRRGPSSPGHSGSARDSRVSTGILDRNRWPREARAGRKITKRLSPKSEMHT